jgi:predicted amidohydrolase
VANGGARIDDHIHGLEQISDAITREADLLYKAITRSEKLLRPHTVRVGTIPALPPKVDFKIGLISRKISISSSGGDLAPFSPPLRLYGREMDPYYYLSRPGDRQKIEKARSSLVTWINRLAKNGANVICVSELGYPAFVSPLDGAVSDIEQGELNEGDLKFRQKIQAISTRYHCIILCGSHHDVNELTNKAILFVPGLDEHIEHRKLTSADAAGETVRAGGNFRYAIYETELGRLGILICKDAYDLNVFCRYALTGSARSTERVPDLILVPAYSRASLADACRELSYFARTTIAYVDANSSPRSALFVAGELVASEHDERESLCAISWEDRHRHIDKATKDQDRGIFATVYGSRTAKRG